LNTTSPFDMLAKKSVSHQKNKAVSLAKNDLSTLWLPLVDALRHQFADLPKEMMETILVMKMQLRDGFLAAGGQ